MRTGEVEFEGIRTSSLAGLAELGPVLLGVATHDTRYYNLGVEEGGEEGERNGREGGRGGREGGRDGGREARWEGGRP